MMQHINLTEYAPVGKAESLNEKERGLDARVFFKLDELDQNREPVIVNFPEQAYSVTTSFFCGLFGESYLEFGSAEKFFEHYRLQANEPMWTTIEEGMKRFRSTFKNRILPN